MLNDNQILYIMKMPGYNNGWKCDVKVNDVIFNIGTVLYPSNSIVKNKNTKSVVLLNFANFILPKNII